MMMNRVKTVKPMPDYRLDIVFRDGKHGIFDCLPYRDYPCLRRIWDEDVFSRVVADHGTVVWPDGSDLCPDEVYDKAVPLEEAGACAGACPRIFPDGGAKYDITRVCQLKLRRG